MRTIAVRQLPRAEEQRRTTTYARSTDYEYCITKRLRSGCGELVVVGQLPRRGGPTANHWLPSNARRPS